MVSYKITQWLFKKINKGTEVEPRRLKFAKSINLVWLKKDGVWLDLGAGNGSYLRFMNEKSFGLDIKQDIEKKIFSWNFNEKVPDRFIASADVIWCSALIEHVLRPHEFLIEIRKFLKPDGLLLIIAPITRLFNPLLLSGTYHGDHVNFFNTTTLKLTLERAGYQILHKGATSFKKIGQKFYFLSPNILFVLKPVPNFQYPKSAHKYLDHDQNIIFKEENIGH
jgi:SAM-dependent methyltransferase